MNGRICMEKEEHEKTLKKRSESDRRKRINRLKKVIIATVICAILIPIILCVILLIRVNRLEEKLNSLEAVSTNSVENIPEELMEQPDQASQKNIPQENSDSEMDTSDSGVENDRMDEAETGPATEDVIRRVYLTFDDGPSVNTEDILQILDDYNVKATFFVVGRTDAHSEQMYRRIVEEGHTLGMHSYSHEYSTIYESPEAFREDLHKLRNYLYDVTGVECSFYRFPGGSSNEVSRTDIQELIAILQSEGITYFDWNVSSQDASARMLSVDEIIENCTGQLEDHRNVVILMHDAAGKTTTVEALPILIEKLQSMEDTVLLPITEDTVPVQHRKPE